MNSNHGRATGDAHLRFVDQSRFPPSGTMCADCGCCRAGIYAGAGELRVAICIACDEGTVCAPKKHATVLSALTRDECETLAAKFPEAPPAPAEVETGTPTPHALQPAPAQETTTMPLLYCKGGCGKLLPETNKNGYAWGHATGCPGDTPPPHVPGQSDAEPADELDAPAEVSMNLTATQLDRIWTSLPLEEKALAIQTALSAERQ